MSVCDTVEGPIVELTDGTLTAVNEPARAARAPPRVRRLVDLGEILVAFGEFLENNRALVPGAYSLAWHLEELAAAGATDRAGAPTIVRGGGRGRGRRTASRSTPVARCSGTTFTAGEIRRSRRGSRPRGAWSSGGSTSRTTPPERRSCSSGWGVPHGPRRPGLRLEREPTPSGRSWGPRPRRPRRDSLVRAVRARPDRRGPSRYVSRLAGCTRSGPARPRGSALASAAPRRRTSADGARTCTCCFRSGPRAVRTRSVSEAARARRCGDGIRVALGLRRVPGVPPHDRLAPVPVRHPHRTRPASVVQQPLPVAPIWSRRGRPRLDLAKTPVVKGVKGLTSPGKVPELIEKGILRAPAPDLGLPGRDGPFRPHRPAPHALPPGRDRTAGRACASPRLHDRLVRASRLSRREQLVELCPQDLMVVPQCGTTFAQLAEFVDEELVAPLQPGTVLRGEPRDRPRRGASSSRSHRTRPGGRRAGSIGFTDAEACFAHPVFHAAKRRNCDGDEDSVTLLLDALLNFSRSYLPESRGAL